MRSFVNKAEAIVGQQGRFRIPLQRPLLPDEMLKIVTRGYQLEGTFQLAKKRLARRSKAAA
jgi:hypothetical protein